MTEPPSYAGSTTDVWVEMRPSVRPGMTYDLAGYPPSWIVAAAA